MRGLDHVYLLNGFRYEQTSRGRRLHIEAQEGLHKAIGAHLVYQNRGLTGKELRFLREELDLSQADLARMLGESDQSVARREKREDRYARPSTQDRALRFLYEEKWLHSDQKLADFLRSLADAGDAPPEDVAFSPEGGEWRQAA